MLKKLRGFTLIELLIVVAIVGILAALLIPNAITAIQKAKQKSTMKDMTTIATALTDYVTDKQTGVVNNGAITVTTQNYLSPFYVKIVPLNDMWGYPYEVYSGLTTGAPRGCPIFAADDHIVVSLGRGGVSDGIDYDPLQPEDALYILNTLADFNNDLIMYDGEWVRGPVKRIVAQ